MKQNVARAKVKRGCRGFSLLEIIIVVAVVAILIGLLVGALYKARVKATRSVAQQELNGIANLLENYFNDLHAYPTSTPYDDVPSGSASLAQALVGWRPFAEDGAGTANGDPDEFGFRLQKGGRGQKFGQYLSPGGKNYDAARHVVLDHWGNPILYYRAGSGSTHVFGTGTDSVFMSADNPAAGNPMTAPDFLKALGDANGDNRIDAGDVIAGRASYILVSGGPDGAYFSKDGLINTK